MSRPAHDRGRRSHVAHDRGLDGDHRRIGAMWWSLGRADEAGVVAAEDEGAHRAAGFVGR
jgi:hypothetical protein